MGAKKHEKENKKEVKVEIRPEELVFNFTEVNKVKKEKSIQWGHYGKPMRKLKPKS
jgi:hypothetical protein